MVALQHFSAKVRLAARPTEGRLAGKTTAGDVARKGDCVCHLGDGLGDVVERLRAARKDACIVVDDHHVVLGRVRGRALEEDPDPSMEDVMRSGPSTIRPNASLESVVQALRDGSVTNTLVTDPASRLIGTIYLEDAERKLSEQEPS